MALAVLLGTFSSSCFEKNTTKVRRGGVDASQSKPPMVASGDELNNRIAAEYNAVQSFQATVELSASVGSVYKDKITEYRDIHAFVLYRKPADIRLIGKLPIVGTTVFDMASIGDSFRVSFPPKFFVGQNSAPAVSKNSLENLRPYALLASMMIKPLDAPNELMFLEDDTDEKDSFYVVHYLHKTADNSVTVARAVWFSRVDLAIVRQREYDETGLITSDTRYKNWTKYNGVPFPNSIDIKRPKDGYGVTMTIEKMDVNLPLTDDKFVLPPPPPDVQIQTIGDAAKKEPVK